jgi:hypothetical protein
VLPEQIHAESRRGHQSGDIRVMLVRQDFRGRHERDLQAVLHRDDGRQQRDDGLPCPDVPLEQSMHRRRQTHVVDDLLDRLTLSWRQLEGQDPCGRLANPVINRRHPRLGLHAALVSPPRVP